MVYTRAMVPSISSAHQMLRNPSGESPARPVLARMLPSGTFIKAHITTATAYRATAVWTALATMPEIV